MKKIQFKFDIEEKVKIIQTGKIGRVTGLFIGDVGIKQYLVKYQDRNGALFEQYFTTEELRKLK